MEYSLLIGFILLLLILYLFARQILGRNINKKLFLVPAFFALFILMGLRSTSVGFDTLHYSQIFKSISNTNISDIFIGSYDSSIEIGYAFLMKLCSFVIDDYYFFQIVISLLYCYLMYIFVYKNIGGIFTSVILFISIGLYLYAFNITRQMFALALVIHAWTYMKQKRYVYTMIFYILGISMHTSAVIALLIYLGYYYRNNRKFILSFFVFIIILPFIFYSVIELLIVYFPVYSSFYSNDKTIQTAGIVKFLWLSEFLLALYMLFVSKKKDNSFIALMSIFYVCSNFIGMFFNYFERVGLYFLPFVILLFVNFGENIRTPLSRNIYFVFLNLCMIIYFFKSVDSIQYIYSSFL